MDVVQYFDEAFVGNGRRVHLGAVWQLIPHMKGNASVDGHLVVGLVVFVR
jgi:hypothetical protein